MVAEMPAPSPNPSALDYVPYFEELIRIQENAIGSFKKWAGVFGSIGTSIIFFTILFRAPIGSITVPMIGLGTLFIGASVVFPYREIAPRRARIQTYRLIKGGFEKPHLSDEERNRLTELADETMKRTM